MERSFSDNSKEMQYTFRFLSLDLPKREMEIIIISGLLSGHFEMIIHTLLVLYYYCIEAHQSYSVPFVFCLINTLQYKRVPSLEVNILRKVVNLLVVEVVQEVLIYWC